MPPITRLGRCDGAFFFIIIIIFVMGVYLDSRK